MKFRKVRKIFKFVYIVFNFLVFITMFLPCISLDKYVEYTFDNGYYNPNYQGYTQSIATKMAPCDFITLLFSDRADLNNAEKEFNSLVENLDSKLLTGQITEDEYYEILANAPETNKYYPLALYYGSEKDVSRLKDKMFIYSILILIFYVVTLLLLMINIINYNKNIKLISISNFFVGWIQVVLLVVFNIYTFSLAISSKTNITGFSGIILEETTICMSPKLIPILLLVLYAIYSFIAMTIDRIEGKYEKQYKEIPAVISDNIPTNAKRKINYKKRKYKHGSKKKRYR